MIRTASQTPVKHSVEGSGGACERIGRLRQIREDLGLERRGREHFALFAVVALAVFLAGSLSAKAQTVSDPQTDIQAFGPFNQANPAGNTNGPSTFTATANSSTVASPIVVLDSANAQSLADAVAAVRGILGVPNSPVLVNQSTNNAVSNAVLSVTNSNELDFFATATAFSGLVDITNTTITGGTIAISRATADAALDAAVTQSHVNAPLTTGAGPFTQTVTETNTNDQSFFATAVAVGDTTVGDDVRVSSTGPVNTAVDGVSAQSLAVATAHIDSAVTQSNSNLLTSVGATGVNNDVIQTQTVSQTNGNDEDMFATSVAVAGDVGVSRDGNTTAGANGINAVSSAIAPSTTIRSRVTQSNTNSLNGTASGGSANPLSPTASDVTQTQTVTQNNDNDQLLAATSVAVGGDVTVSSTGDTDAGLNGINATSSALVLNNTVDSAVTQSNTNSATGQTTGANLFGGNVTQTQTVTQSNDNDQLLASTSVAVAGDVTVTNEGDTDAGDNPGDNGINAVSQALASASIANAVTQSNTNTASANTSGGSLNSGNITQTQTAPQNNDNDQLLAATSVAVGGDVTVSNLGDTDAGGNGINAGSGAIASAAIGSVTAPATITQTNTNSATGPGAPGAATTTGPLAPISQSQSKTQSNDNDQLLAATSVAIAGDVTVSNDGPTQAVGNGINAESAASAGASINSAVAQTNSNSASGTTSGAVSLLTQTQSPSQTNDNAQLLAATSVADGGDITVYSGGGDTYAGGNGINATSGAIASATINNVVAQTNSNSANGTTSGAGSLLTQTQITPPQTNVNTQVLAATSISEGGDVTVDSEGYAYAGLEGINAASEAISSASIGTALTQTNANSATGTTNGAAALLTQSQIPVQTNVNTQIFAATSVVESGDVTVDSDADTDAGGNGINAASNAVGSATISSAVTQSNSNSATGTTIGAAAVLTQIQIPVQTNVNTQVFAATSVVESGDVAVYHEGDTDAGGNGINAASNAVGSATINSALTQGNSNSATGTTSGAGALLTQTQIFPPQTNVNTQIFAATSVVESGDVTVYSGSDTDAGGDGINAASNAVGSSTINSAVTQTNSNSATGTKTGTGALAQTQTPLQTNVNTQIFAATSAVESGDVTVDSEGETYAGGDGITAASNAVGSATLNS
jgi:hypothetical protein